MFGFLFFILFFFQTVTFRILHLVELTVTYEDSIDAAQTRMEDRYEGLLRECEEAGWRATHLSVEVGRRLCLDDWAKRSPEEQRYERSLGDC